MIGQTGFSTGFDNPELARTNWVIKHLLQAPSNICPIVPIGLNESALMSFEDLPFSNGHFIFENNCLTILNCLIACSNSSSVVGIYGGYGSKREKTEICGRGFVEESRSDIFLGIKILVKGSLSVASPLAGKFYSRQLNKERNSVVLTLCHQLGPVKFFTRYSGLQSSYLNALEPGDKVEGGDTIAVAESFQMGAGKLSYFDFQLIVSKQGTPSCVPLYTSPSLAAKYQIISPNPAFLFRLT
jgi:biotin carboxyl carrier protein